MSAGYEDDRDRDRYEEDRYEEDRRDDDSDGPRRPGRADLARRRVAVPAVLLIANGVLGLVFATFLFVISVAAPEIMVDWFKQLVAAQPAGPEKQQNEQKVKELEDKLKQDRTANAVTSTLELGAFAVLNLVAIFGAVKMRSGRGYGWGLASSIISLIPCTTGCCCTGPLIGLWGLIVLLNEDVKAGFAAAGRSRARDEY
jgi:hypothetical protein